MEGGNFVRVVPLEVSNSDIIEDFLGLVQVVTTRANLSMFAMVNIVEITLTSRLIDSEDESFYLSSL